MQVLSVSAHIPLQAGEGAGIAHAGAASSASSDRTASSGPGLPVAVPLRGQQDGAAVEVEPPGGTRAEAAAASMAVSAVVE